MDFGLSPGWLAFVVFGTIIGCFILIIFSKE